ncbi:MAG: hypothetical protein M1570_03200 [Chloroflexi bacterium]|nr:hypothetical protein [Chloroflexota bacterium]
MIHRAEPAGLDFVFYNLFPNGKALKGYGTHRVGRQLMMADWSVLFDLLAQGKIQSIIGNGGFTLIDTGISIKRDVLATELPAAGCKSERAMTSVFLGERPEHERGIY